MCSKNPFVSLIAVREPIKVFNWWSSGSFGGRLAGRSRRQKTQKKKMGKGGSSVWPVV